MTLLRLGRVFLVLCVAAAVLQAAGAAADETARKQFLAWYRTFTGSVIPPEVLKAYATKLAAGGAPEAEVKEQMAAVQRYFVAMPPELLTAHFNNV